MNMFAKYKIMLLYTFLFFSASISIIILGSNMTYEVVIGRQEKRPSFIKQEDSWVVQRTTKGVPPIRIATRTEWRQGTSEDYQTTMTTQVHWGSILGVVAFSVFMAGVLVFIGAVALELLSKVEFPPIRQSGPVVGNK
jgi:hypothetical protein